MLHNLSCKLRGIFHRLCTGKTKNIFDLSIGAHVRISGNVIFSGKNKILWGGRVESSGNGIIFLGEGVNVQQHCHITCGEKVSIGDNTAITANVTITDIIHPYQDIGIAPVYQEINTRPVVIEENCLISNNAVILPGSHLGKHTIVAANSVVCGLKTKGYCVVAGSPAKVVKFYDADLEKWLSPSSDKN
ncbi:acyltransferase [Vibrio campbellii]|uniref:acyltransferase n=1 Tax=Vibrio campbellii TaxID=680 RepID=UPI00385737E1